MESQLGVGRAGCRPRLGSSALLGPQSGAARSGLCTREGAAPPGGEEELTPGNRGHGSCAEAAPDDPGIRVPHSPHAPTGPQAAFLTSRRDTHDSRTS